jgi:hypothetical protein
MPRPDRPSERGQFTREAGEPTVEAQAGKYHRIRRWFVAVVVILVVRWLVSPDYPPRQAAITTSVTLIGQLRVAYGYTGAWLKAQAEGACHETDRAHGTLVIGGSIPHDLDAAQDSRLLQMTQHRLTQAIEKVSPERIDITIEQWSTAHAVLAWANLSGPTCCLLN